STPTVDAAITASTSPSPVAVSQTLVLKSSAFAVGGAMPGDFTCDGAAVSPPLTWSGAPQGTRAFALVEEDADAASASEPFTQWLIYNLPVRVRQLEKGVEARPLLTNGGQQGLNSNKTIGYTGPCPDKGAPPHHYSFQLFAQDDYITLETGATAAEV